LVFKELKSHTELRKFLTGNDNIVQGFIWAAFCGLLIRRFLVSCAQQFTDIVLSFHKAAISARVFMLEFTGCALNRFIGLQNCLIRIIDYLCSTMHLSNPQRRSSFQNADLQVETMRA